MMALFMNRFVLLIIFSYFLLPSPGFCKSVRIVMYELSPYASPNLENGGFVPDIITTAFERAGYDVDGEFLPWLRCLKTMEKGSKDVMINMFYTEERAMAYGYPKTHLAVMQYVFYVKKERRDIPDKIGISELKKMRVGLARKASYGPRFDAVIDQLPNVYFGIREAHMLQMLIAGRLDIVPSSFYAGMYALSQIDKNYVDTVKRIESDLFDKKKLFPIFNQKNSEYRNLMADYDDQMAQMAADGTLAKICRTHNQTYRGQHTP